MTKEDICAVKKFYPSWIEELKPKSAVFLSPTDEYETVKEIVSYLNIDIKTIEDWDLNKSIEKKWDLCIVHNVFHYSKNPKIWFKNVFNSCDTIWIIDHIDRDRGPIQLGDDGDSMRFELLPDVPSNFLDPYNLNNAGRITKMFTYINPTTGIVYNPYLQNISFIAEIKKC